MGLLAKTHPNQHVTPNATLQVDFIAVCNTCPARDLDTGAASFIDSLPTPQVPTIPQVLSCSWTDFKINVCFYTNTCCHKKAIYRGGWWDVHIPKVWRVGFWMRKYGAKSAKRTRIWSNTPQIRRFMTGKLKLRKRDRRRTLAKTYVDANGKKRFSGKRNAMRASARLIWIYYYMYMHAMFMFSFLHVCVCGRLFSNIPCYN